MILKNRNVIPIITLEVLTTCVHNHLLKINTLIKVIYGVLVLYIMKCCTEKLLGQP